MEWILSDESEIHFSFVNFKRKMEKGGRLIKLNVLKCKIDKKLVNNRLDRVLIWRNLTCFFQKILELI